MQRDYQRERSDSTRNVHQFGKERDSLLSKTKTLESNNASLTRRVEELEREKNELYDTQSRASDVCNVSYSSG